MLRSVVGRDAHDSSLLFKELMGKDIITALTLFRLERGLFGTTAKKKRLLLITLRNFELTL